MAFRILCLLLFYYTASAQITIIHCGYLLDVEKGKFLEKRSVFIQGNKIIGIEKGFIESNSIYQTIDLKNKYVMPGLIDMHVHIEFQINPKTYLDKFVANDADIAFRSVGFARSTLMSGFTTVRDLGGTGVNISLRNAINSGQIDGPRILTVGKALSSTGGHADPTNGNKKSLIGNPGPKEGVVNGVEDARKAVRQRYKNGADHIKITATGGVLSLAKSGDNPQFTVEEIYAITEIANDYGMHVAAHAHGDQGIKRAILGGVKTIEHGTKMSEKTMEMMKKYNVYYVPTITAGEEVSTKAEVDGYYPEIVRPKAREIGPKIKNTFAKAYKKGVPIAFGTDAGVFKHGENAREFEYMVAAGMPVIETLQAATIVNAKLLKMDNQIGSIAVGKFADIIASKENPINNIRTLQNIIFVMKNGVVHKQ